MTHKATGYILPNENKQRCLFPHRKQREFKINYATTRKVLQRLTQTRCPLSTTLSNEHIGIVIHFNLVKATFQFIF